MPGAMNRAMNHAMNSADAAPAAYSLRNTSSTCTDEGAAAAS
jgi:hypothetical protein